MARWEMVEGLEPHADWIREAVRLFKGAHYYCEAVSRSHEGDHAICDSCGRVVGARNQWRHKPQCALEPLLEVNIRTGETIVVHLLPTAGVVRREAVINGWRHPLRS